MPVSVRSLVGRVAQYQAYVSAKIAMLSRLDALVGDLNDNFPADVRGNLDDNSAPVGSVDLDNKLLRLFGDVERCFAYLYDVAGEGTPPVFETSFTGDVSRQQSFARNIEIFNAADADLTEIIAGMEGGGESSTEWFIYWDGDATQAADQPDVGDSIDIGDQTYTFATPTIEEGPVYTYGGANELATHIEVESPGNQNYLFNVVNAIVYLIFDANTGIAAGLISDGTVAPSGSLQVDIDSYSALNSAIIADPDQSEGPWPPLRIFADDPFTVDFSGLAAAAQMRAQTAVD